ncbi:MAG: hypothetical protein M3Z04_13650 [Chloroflexota bacterium]|nr:hypothetical protein [Chloroflexota bacterium]
MKIRHASWPPSLVADRGTARWWSGLALILLVGLLLRGYWLTTPGYNGMGVWKAWAYGTNRVGITEVYRLRQHPEPALTWTTLTAALTGGLPAVKVGFPDRAFDPDYPPGTFYLLGALAGAYRTWISPTFRDGPLLNVTIKLPLLLAELATALLLGWAVGHRRGPGAGLAALASYWLNPTVLLGGSILAFLDAFYSLALLAGAVALLHGRVRGLWLGWAVALALKPQALLVLPAVVLLTSRGGPLRTARQMVPAGSLLLAISLPMLLTGHLLGLLAGVAGNAHEGYVSANQFNLWWLWSYLYARRLGHLQAAILQQGQLTALTISQLRMWGWVLFACWTFFLGQGWWERARLTARNALPGAETVLLLALQLYGGVMLLTSMHENHLLGVLPLLALAAWWIGAPHQAVSKPVRRALQTRKLRLRPLPAAIYYGGTWLPGLLYVGVSVVTGANLLMIFGLGVGAPYPLPRIWGGLDGSMVITGLNLLLFALGAGGWAALRAAPRPL